VVCMQYGMTDEAFQYLNQALALDPGHYLAHNLLGLAFMIKGDLPNAVQSFQKSIEVNPDFSEARNNLGTALEESGDAVKAEAAYLKSIDIDQNYSASYNLAKLYFGQKKLDPALHYVLLSLQKYGRSVLAWNLLGLIYESRDNTSEAIASFQQALKIVPGETNVSYNLAFAYYKSGESAKAKDMLEKILPLAKTEELKARIRELLQRIG
jgi:Flp pilus assembly protein TadD